MKNKCAVPNSCSSGRFANFQGLTVLLLAAQVAGAFASDRPSGGRLDAAELARTVTIYRDRYGVPHIDGPTDESVIFGFAYCQAEDYLWQI